MRSATMNMMVMCATLAFASGCTLLYASDADKKQCTSDADCSRLASESGSYECKASVCVAIEGAQSSDAGADAATDTRVACKNAKDCSEGERCGFDGFCYEKWGCLDDDPDWLDNVKQEFTYESTMRSLQSPDDATLLGEISAMACSAADPACERPKVPASAVTVGADKVLTVPFSAVGSSGFVGVIQILAGLPADSPTAKPVLPGFFHYTAENPLVTDVVTQDRALLIDEGTYGLLGALAGTSADSSSGTNVFLVYDCGGQSAADVSIVPSAGVTGFRFIPIQGETTPVIDGRTTTTDDGVGILINIPPGAQAFVLKDEKLGRVISDTFSFNVRGDAINYVQYYPRHSALKAWLDEHQRQTAKR